jgi:hypothetical protein
MNNSLLTAILVCVLTCASTGAAFFSGKKTVSSTEFAVPKPGLIIAGHSVGDLRLGDARDRISEMFRRKPNVDGEVFLDSAPLACHRTEIHWLDMERINRKLVVHSGVWIYVKDDRVFQIESETPRFRTPEGVTEQSLPEQVRRTYKNLQAFALMSSSNKINGPRDLVYWVDQEKGIAFELYYNGVRNRRLVAKIAVFAPETTFQPRGCVDEPQVWNKLRPYSLEPD